MNDYKVIGVDSVVNLLIEVFGQPVYRIAEGESHSVEPIYNASFNADEKYTRYSQFDTPVVGNFTIKGGNFKVYDKDGRLADKVLGYFEFPLATIVDFSRPKNITKTPTIGSGGTVKEIFGSDDWKINIRGLLLDDSSRLENKTVKEQLDMLRKLSDIAGSLEIYKGDIFFDKNISRIAIERLDITPVQGKPGLIQYEMECSSDEDFLIMGV